MIDLVIRNRTVRYRCMKEAILQSFPTDYKFVQLGERIRINELGRVIGNAVLVLLGQIIGRSIKSHLISRGFKRVV